jgi:hypothetical protein
METVPNWSGRFSRLAPWRMFFICCFMWLGLQRLWELMGTRSLRDWRPVFTGLFFAGVMTVVFESRKKSSITE